MLVTTTIRSMFGRMGNVMGTLAALALAVAIMLGAILVLLATLSGPGVPARLAATDLVARPDLAVMFDTTEDSVPTGMSIRMPAEQVRLIAQVEGIESVIADVTFSAQILEADGTPLQISEDAVPRGQSWESAALTPFVMIQGDEPKSPNDIVVDQQIADVADLEVGQEIRVVTNHSTDFYLVAGIAAPATGIEIERQSSLFFASETATTLAGGGDAADLVGVFLEEGADEGAVQDRIQVATDGMAVQVLGGQDRARADVTAGSMEVMELGIILGVLSGFVGFVAIFVLMSTIGFSIQQRAQEIGLQRAIGYTPKQVRSMILVETLAISVVGALIGILLAPVVARVFVLVGVQFGGVPASFQVPFDPLGVLIVVGSVIGIVLIAAWLAGRKTARIHPMEALRSASVPRVWIGWRRLAVGVGFMAGGVVAVVASASLPTDAAVSMALLVVAMLTIGCSILGPLMMLPFVRIGRLLAVGGKQITGELAVNNTRRMAARVASSVVPVVLGVGFLALMFGFTATMESATVQITDGREIADLHVVPVGSALPADAGAVIELIDGVGQAEVIQSMQVSYEATDYSSTAEITVMAPERIASFQELEFSSGSLGSFVPGTVLISSMLDFGGSTGSKMLVTMADGQERELIVAGEVKNLMGLGDMLMTPEDAALHMGDSTPNSIVVNLTEGADPSAVTSSIEDLASDGYPLQVLTHEQYVSGVQQSMQESVWATYLIIGGAAAFGLVATINTLSMSIAERSREFALMRLIGATSSQVLRMLAREASLIVIAGLALGWGIAIVSTGPASLGLVGDLSAMSMPVLPLIGTGLVAALVVFGATMISGAMALRADPVTQVGRKE